MPRRLFDAAAATCLFALGMIIVAPVALRSWPRTRLVSVYARDGERIAYRVMRLFPRGRTLWALNYLFVLLPVISGRFSFTGARIAWIGRYARSAERDGLPGAAESRRNRWVRELTENARSYAVIFHYSRACYNWWRRLNAIRIRLRIGIRSVLAGKRVARLCIRDSTKGATSITHARHANPPQHRGTAPSGEMPTVPPYAWSGSPPGLLSPYVLQRRANLQSDGPDRSDQRFSLSAPLKAHMALIARFFFSLALGAAPRRIPAKVKLMDVEIANISMAVALERIAEMARGPSLHQVAFVNADCLNISVKDARYRNLLARLPLVLADGIGMRQALKWFMGTGLKENVNGTDLFPHLCRLAADRRLSVYLLGARPGVAERAAQAAQQLAPTLQIAGTHDGYFTAEQCATVVDAINASGADILLVAMGVPAQEFWIRDHAAALRPGVAIGVGGLLDFYSGRIARAPLWMREIGLEWIYRLLQEPGRMWRRYLIGNPLFLYRVWRWSAGEHRSRHRDTMRVPAATAGSRNAENTR